MAPSLIRDSALRRCVGMLLFLGAQQAVRDDGPAMDLWSIGRAMPLRAAPPLLLFALLPLGLTIAAGRLPRTLSALAAACMAALYALVPATYHNNHYLLFVLLVLSAIAPDGGPRRIDLSRAVRAQVGLVYLASIVAKLQHPWWRDGGALLQWVAVDRAPGANPSALLPSLLQPLFSHAAPARAAQLGVLALETALPFALAHRRTRDAAFVAGISMHLVMQEWLFPQLFTFLMLLGYTAWSAAGDHAWRARASPRVAALVRSVDLLGRAVVDDAASAGLAVTAPSGRTVHGAAALLALLPLTPLAVVAYAAIAILVPEWRGVGAVSRDALENVVVLGTMSAVAAVHLRLAMG